MNNNNSKSKPSQTGRQKSSRVKAAAKKTAGSFQNMNLAPVAIQTKFNVREPRIINSVNGCVVSHCERFGTINGSTAFAVSKFSINPGLLSTFPWLSNIASRFESYKFRKLKFLYKTKTATTSLGDITLGVDYDAADPDPASTTQIENWSDSVNSVPWDNVSLTCSNKNLQKEREWYTRNTALDANLDIKTYDVGNLFVATEGQASSALIGYMYVEYEIEFNTPQLLFGDVVLGGSFVGGSSMSGANPLGTPVFDPQDIGINYNSTNVINVLNPGTYLLTFSVVGTVITALTVALGANQGTVTESLELINGAGTTALAYYRIVVSVPNALMSFVATATTVTASTVNIAVAPANSLN